MLETVYEKVWNFLQIVRKKEALLIWWLPLQQQKLSLLKVTLNIWRLWILKLSRGQEADFKGWVLWYEQKQLQNLKYQNVPKMKLHLFCTIKFLRSIKYHHQCWLILINTLKYPPVSNQMMSQKGSKHVAIERSNILKRHNCNIWNNIWQPVFTDTVDVWWEDPAKFAKIRVS